MFSALHGVLSLPGAMLAHNADPAVRAAWLKDMFLRPDWPPIQAAAPTFALVAEGGRPVHLCRA